VLQCTNAALAAALAIARNFPKCMIAG